MTKFLNTLKAGINLVIKSAVNQWFSFIGLLWMFASFIYIGEPQFWTVLGFGIMFTGVQTIVDQIKLKN